MKIYPRIKRVIDFGAALVMLVLLSPLLLATALLVKATDKEAILFRQSRPGRNARCFTLYKFKTMVQKTHGPDGRRLTDMERMTRVGRWLRQTSLDELPQLFNILKGEMSFIGPRPLLIRYLPYYTPFQARRHEVMPGISGWAQVNGRNRIAWEDRLAMDVWYADHMSPGLDAKILGLTLVNLITRRGVNQDEDETMPFFDEQVRRDRHE